MSRRGRSGPTISLFAFQDIITSVTAIVMVITLLLAVDLVQRKRSQAADSSGEIAAEIAQRLDQAQRELATLKNAVTVTDEIVREVAATSPAEVRNDIAQRESVITQLQHDGERLGRQQKDLAKLEKEVAAEQFDLEPLRQQKTLTDRATADLERQLQQERQENRTVFTLPRGSQKEGWLAVVEVDRIVVAPMGRPSKPVEFRAKGLAPSDTTAAIEFGTWIAQQGLESAYFLLLVRPGASSAFDAAENILVKRSVSYGFDVIGRDVMVIHPERGAAP